MKPNLRWAVRGAALLSVCLCSPFAAAQAPQHPASVKQLLDGDTLAVGWVDIEKSDIAKTLQFVTDAIGSNNGATPDQIAQDLQGMTAFRDALVSLKVTRIYSIVERGTFTQPPECVVIPTNNPAAVKILIQSLIDSPRRTMEVQGDCIIAGRKEQVSDILKRNGQAQPELSNALDSNTGVGGLVALTPAEITLPLLGSSGFKQFFSDKPVEIVSATQAIAAVQSISLSTELPPVSATLRFRSQSQAAAADLKALVASQLTEEQGGGNATPVADVTTSGNETIVKVTSNAQAVAVVKLIKNRFGTDPAQDANNLKQIALALHIYHDVNGSFPPQALTDKDGKKLLSWRVLILPYLEQAALFKSFKLDESWDSPHNLPLSQTIVPTYSDASLRGKEVNHTRFLVPLSEKSIFGRPGKPARMRDIFDGTSNTLLCLQVPAHKSVPWAKPEDIRLDSLEAFAKLYPAPPKNRILIGIADGSVRTLTMESFQKVFEPLTTMNGGEVIDYDELK